LALAASWNLTRLALIDGAQQARKELLQDGRSLWRLLDELGHVADDAGAEALSTWRCRSGKPATTSGTKTDRSEPWTSGRT